MKIDDRIRDIENQIKISKTMARIWKDYIDTNKLPKEIIESTREKLRLEELKVSKFKEKYPELFI